MDERVLILLFGFINLFGTCTADICYTMYGSALVCHYGCCGYYGDECCEAPFPVYVLVLGILGGIIVFSVIVAVVCVFCFKKKKRGRIVDPYGPTVIQPTPIHTTSFIVQPPAYAYNNVYQSAIPPPPAYSAPTPNAHAQPNDPPVFNRPEGLQSQPPTGGAFPGNSLTASTGEALPRIPLATPTGGALSGNQLAAPAGGGLPGNHLVV